MVPGHAVVPGHTVVPGHAVIPRHAVILRHAVIRGQAVTRGHAVVPGLSMATGWARDAGRRHRSGQEGAETERAAHGGQQIALLGPLDPVRDHLDTHVPAHPDQRLDQGPGRGVHAHGRHQAGADPDQVHEVVAQPGQRAVPGIGDVHSQPDTPLAQLTEPAQHVGIALGQY